MEASHANLTALRATRTPTHANTRAAGALHGPLHAHRVKTTRTSPRARKHAQRHYRAVPCASALCWHPMAVPSRPHQPRASRTTRARRTTTHAATRAPQCTSHCSLRPLLRRLHPLQAPYRTGARRARQDASPRGARGGTPRAQATAHALRHPTRAAAQPAAGGAAALPVLNIQPACSAAPLPPRACTTQILHCTRRARGTLRARSAIRSVCCPVCLHTAQSTCKEPKVHVHAAQSPHSDAARTPRQSPASRRASACRTQYCAHCSIFVTKRKQKPPHRGHRNPKKILNKTTPKIPKRKGERRARKNILPKFLRQSTF